MAIRFDENEKSYKKEIPNPLGGYSYPTFTATYDPKSNEPVIMKISLYYGDSVYQANFSWDEWQAITSHMNWQHSQQLLEK